MTTKHILYIAAAGMLLTACSSDEPDDGRLPDGKYPLSLTASIGSPQTRAGGMDNWQGGEEIAVSIGNYTGKYTIQANGKVFDSGSPYYWQNTDKATVRAWYPYTEDERNYDISEQTQGYADFDFLYAETEGSYAAPVQLVFSHLMSKVSYTLVKGDGITDTEFASASVTLLGDKSVTISGGKITSVAVSQTDEIKPCHDASDNVGSAVMTPQDMTGKPLIKVNISGNDFIYTPDTEAAGKLRGGYQHSYTITLKTNGIEVTAATGGEWTESGNEDVASKEVKQAYSSTDLKLGDYYYSDGTWSDGGLRKLYSDGTMKWAETSPQPESNKTCIGIVFYAGQHETDTGDYTATGIGQSQCHGYVVALTDVHNDSGDRLCWEYGPSEVYNKEVGTSASPYDWNGYSNSLKFHEFVEDPNNKYAGWEMKHFPAALACETYGNRTLDQDGNDANGKYDWQKPLAAPSNTSGWFLPSCGQLKYLEKNRSSLAARMDIVKSSVPDNCNYADKIKWFSKVFYYWSSTEDSSFTVLSYLVDLYSGLSNIYTKEGKCDVRAVLAF